MKSGERLVAGCMTGTSLDAIDAAVVRVRGAGFAMRAEMTAFATRGLGSVGERLRALASGEAMTAGAIAALSREFSIAIGEVVAEAAYGSKLDLACVHGQTVFHEPPVSWQLLTPALIAERLGCDVVSDLRAADLAAGGQGAPITPMADWVMYAGSEERAIVNLGGFVNVTLLPAMDTGSFENVRGFDVCPCNLALDEAARLGMGCAYDAGGALALCSEADEMVVFGLLDSTAREGESLGSAAKWIGVVRRSLEGGVEAGVVARSVCAAVARAIGGRVPKGWPVFLAGGGAKNGALVEELARVRGSGPRMADEIGVPGYAREAAAMAVLGALCADGVAITLPGVTGCRRPAPVAGEWSRRP